jgi:hypothetical protein
MDPVAIVGIAAAALQIGQQLIQLKNRILAKPADEKTLLAIRGETQQNIDQLRKYENDLTGEARDASRELRDVLQDIVNEIDALGKRRRTMKMLTCLSIYSPQFEQRLSLALRTFQFKFALQNQKQSDQVMEIMTKEMADLKISKDTLGKISGMDEAMAVLNTQIRALEMKMEDVRTSQLQLQNSLEVNFPNMVSEIKDDVRRDGGLTRELMNELCNSRN